MDWVTPWILSSVPVQHATRCGHTPRHAEVVTDTRNHRAKGRRLIAAVVSTPHIVAPSGQPERPRTGRAASRRRRRWFAPRGCSADGAAAGVESRSTNTFGRGMHEQKGRGRQSARGAAYPARATGRTNRRGGRRGGRGDKVTGGERRGDPALTWIAEVLARSSGGAYVPPPPPPRHSCMWGHCWTTVGSLWGTRGGVDDRGAAEAPRRRRPRLLLVGCRCDAAPVGEASVAPPSRTTGPCNHASRDSDGGGARHGGTYRQTNRWTELGGRRAARWGVFVGSAARRRGANF